MRFSFISSSVLSVTLLSACSQSFELSDFKNSDYGVQGEEVRIPSAEEASDITEQVAAQAPTVPGTASSNPQTGSQNSQQPVGANPAPQTQAPNPTVVVSNPPVVIGIKDDIKYCLMSQNSPATGSTRGITAQNQQNQNGNKILLCKVPPGNPSQEHEILVPPNAVQSHIKNGSYLGACRSSQPNSEEDQPSTPVSEYMPCPTMN